MKCLENEKEPKKLLPIKNRRAEEDWLQNLIENKDKVEDDKKVLSKQSRKQEIMKLYMQKVDDHLEEVLEDLCKERECIVIFTKSSSRTDFIRGQ